jgi:hypothetical protein
MTVFPDIRRQGGAGKTPPWEAMPFTLTAARGIIPLPVPPLALCFFMAQVFV